MKTSHTTYLLRGGYCPLFTIGQEFSDFQMHRNVITNHRNFSTFRKTENNAMKKCSHTI